jgi:hypothetical protein
MAYPLAVFTRWGARDNLEGRFNGASSQTLHPTVGPGGSLGREREPMGCA